MKITVEVDNNILKDGDPDIQVISIEENVSGLEDLLSLFERLAKAMGYCFKGTLEVQDDEF